VAMNLKKILTLSLAVVGFALTPLSSIAQTFTGVFHVVGGTTTLTALVDPNGVVYDFQTGGTNTLISNELNTNKDVQNPADAYTTINAVNARDLSMANLYKKFVGNTTHYWVTNNTSDPNDGKAGVFSVVNGSTQAVLGSVMIDSTETGTGGSYKLTFKLVFTPQP